MSYDVYKQNLAIVYKDPWDSRNLCSHLTLSQEIPA